MRGVNALNGLTSFLRFRVRKNMGNVPVVCQRPERAYFISTFFGLA